MTPRWILKTEPSAYSWDDLVSDKGTAWSGVRNYTARNNLQAMKKGDRCFIYHSVGPKELVGIAEVAREHYPDATAQGADAAKGWVVVDVRAIEKLHAPVTLAQIKAHHELADMALVKQSRLSVCPVSAPEAKAILALARSAGRR